MASFYDTTIGEQVEFQRVLARAGFDFEDVRRIIKNPSLAKNMLDSLRNDTVSILTSWSRLEKQLKQLRREAPADVPAKWFDVDTSRYYPHTPNAQPLAVLKLPAGDGMSGVHRTFAFYVRLIRERMERMGNSLDCQSALRPYPDYLRLAPKVTHEPGLRIISFDPAPFDEPENKHSVLDLWGSQADLAGPEVLAALALTNYGPTMNHEDRPTMEMPGYQVSNGNEWSRRAYASWSPEGRRLTLSVGYAGGISRDTGCVIPVFRER